MDGTSGEFEQPTKRPLEGYDEAEQVESSQSIKRIRTGGSGRVEVGLLLLNADIGRVIGKGGEKIRSIREESGAAIHIPKASQQAYERTANVNGTTDQVIHAVLTIANLISEENPVVSLLAEFRNLGAVIGKQGVNIKQIREESQANVRISKECLGNSTQKEIRITGSPDSVTQATEAVIRYLAEGRSSVRVPYLPNGNNHPTSPSFGDRNFPPSPSFGRGQNMMYEGRGGGMNMSRDLSPRGNYGDHHRQSSIIRIETSIWVPKEVIGKIIGRSGCHINAVRKQSGAQINVENANEGDEDNPERKITITGRRKSIELACTMIENLCTVTQF